VSTETRGSVFEFDFSEPSGGMSHVRGNRKVRTSPSAKPKTNRAAAAFKKVEILPWTMRIDTAEQLPYTFDNMEADGKQIIVPTNRENIIWGDYAIDSLHTEAVCERKSLDDLYKTLTHGRERFSHEMAALNEPPYKFAMVVIEASWDEVQSPFLQDPNWSNQTYPNSIIGTIHQWMVRYSRVQWWAAGSRRQAEEWVFMILNRYWIEREKRKESENGQVQQQATANS
jgi:ERCC4-type nuclease